MREKHKRAIRDGKLTKLAPSVRTQGAAKLQSSICRIKQKLGSSIDAKWSENRTKYGSAVRKRNAKSVIATNSQSTLIQVRKRGA